MRDTSSWSRCSQTWYDFKPFMSADDWLSRFRRPTLALFILLSSGFLACSVAKGKGVPARGNPLEGAPRIELVQDGFNYTEGPTWHEPSQTLFFVDLKEHAVFRYAPGSKVRRILIDSGGAAGMEIITARRALYRVRLRIPGL